MNLFISCIRSALNCWKRDRYPFLCIGCYLDSRRRLIIRQIVWVLFAVVPYRFTKHVHTRDTTLSLWIARKFFKELLACVESAASQNVRSSFRKIQNEIEVLSKFEGCFFIVLVIYSCSESILHKERRDEQCRNPKAFSSTDGSDPWTSRSGNIVSLESCRRQCHPANCD